MTKIWIYLIASMLLVSSMFATDTCDKGKKTSIRCIKQEPLSNIYYEDFISEAECEQVPIGREGIANCRVILREDVRCYTLDENGNYLSVETKSDETFEYEGGWCSTYTPPPDPKDGPTPGSEEEGQEPGGHTPLVYSNRDYKFSHLDVKFDIDGDNDLDLVSWPMPGTMLLVLDVNKNGKIDSGKELFGNSTFKNSPHGFFSLSSYDIDDNYMITYGDQIFDNRWLMFWDDINHNGISEEGELNHLEDFNISGFGLDYSYVGRTFNNVKLLLKGEVWVNEGRKSYYDAYLPTVETK